MNPKVLVIGAGPVGLTMAAELARFGVAVRVVDKAAHRSDKSKALVIWSRTLELFDRAGWSDAFVRAGRQAHAINITAGDKRLGRIAFDEVASPHPYALMIPQSATERVLEETLATLNVSVERQIEATSLSQTSDGVSVTLRRGDGQMETCQADWVIGCDGAHSFVRHQLGMQFVGNTLPSHWVLADVHLGDGQLSDDEVHLFWHADGTLIVFPIEPGRVRVIADVDARGAIAGAGEPTLEGIQHLLDQRGPGAIRVSDPVWLSSFTINERRVENFRAGRVFVAGDAAHVHSPAGGQGMNTGMQDAFNLTWKLALVCKGICAAEPLLGSYSDERSEIARQVLSETGKLTSVAVLKNPLLQSVRNQIAHLLLGFATVRERAAEKVTELQIRYGHGLLVHKGAVAPGIPAPGARAPLREGEAPPTADHQPRFVLCGEKSDATVQLLVRYPRLLDPALRPPYRDGSLTLLRPDGYVATSEPVLALDKIDALLTAIAAGM